MKALNALLATMAAVVTVTIPLPASAQSTYVWTSIDYTYPDGPGDTAFLSQSFPDRPSSTAVDWSVPGYSVGSSAQAGFGYVRGAAHAGSGVAGDLGHFIEGAYSDQLTLSNAALNGQAGQLSMSFRYDDVLSPRVGDGGASNTNARWYAFGGDADEMTQVSETYNIGGFDVGHHKELYVSDASGQYEGPASFDDHELTLTVSFVWGEPIFVGFGVTAGGYVTGDASYFVEHVGSWNGLLDVTAGGVAVDDYTLTSLSGTDYSRPITAPVPEPGVLGMLGAGLCVLALRCAARRSRRDRAAPMPMPVAA